MLQNIIILFLIGQKINSMKRLLALNEELIKELIPQIGLRAGFLCSWKRLIVSACTYFLFKEVIFATKACSATNCISQYFI